MRHQGAWLSGAKHPGVSAGDHPPVAVRTISLAHHLWPLV